MHRTVIGKLLSGVRGQGRLLTGGSATGLEAAVRPTSGACLPVQRNCGGVPAGIRSYSSITILESDNEMPKLYTMPNGEKV